MRMIERRLIGIYLEDHWAAATGGAELARRLRSSNSEGRWSAPLAQLCAEIEEDRETLREVMGALDVRRNLPKAYGAWAAEKVGRLKLNGRITGYSPLSRVVELEMMLVGITHKLGLWDALSRAERPQLEGFDFEALGRRAQAQRETVEEIHRAAALEALGAQG